MNEKLTKMLEKLLAETEKNERELEELESKLGDQDIYDELWPSIQEDIVIYRNVQYDIAKVIDWIKYPEAVISHSVSYYKNKVEKLQGNE
jgi:hypothetical protein